MLRRSGVSAARAASALAAVAASKRFDPLLDDVEFVRMSIHSLSRQGGFNPVRDVARVPPRYNERKYRRGTGAQTTITGAAWVLLVPSSKSCNSERSHNGRDDAEEQPLRNLRWDVCSRRPSLNETTSTSRSAVLFTACRSQSSG